MGTQTVTSGTVPVTQPKGNRRWTVVIWLFLGGMINYLDRANLSIAAPEMIRDLNLTATDIGLMGAVFSWVYAFSQLPSGWLIDRFGAKRVYSLAILWWSGATALTGLCSKLSSFLFVRGLMGVGEAPCFPTSAKLTARWFPKKERSLATGLWDASTKFGPAIAPPILVGLMIAYGWRALFFITGAIGIVFVVLFWMMYKNPDQDKSLSAEEAAYIQEDCSNVDNNITTSKVSWSSLFKYRSVIGMILGFFCCIWLFNIFMNFLPLFLLKTQHISLKELGIYASIPWIGGIFGDVLGGYIAKKLVDNGIMEPIKAKRALISVAGILAGIVAVYIPFAPSLSVTLGLMTVAVGCVSAISGSAWALAGDIAPGPMVASVGSIQNFGGYFGGALSPVITGMIVDSTGSFTLAFISGGIIAACAALCYWFIVKDPISEA